MKNLLMIAVLSICMNSCTYNISMSHTSGGSTDTTNDPLSTTPNVSPTINVPITPGAGIGLAK